MQSQQENPVNDSRHIASVRLEEVERAWSNLNQTVPPHARDWWDLNYAPEQGRLEALWKRFEAAQTDWEASKVVFMDELEAFERMVAQAAEELGGRTAAGRAKERLGP